MNKKGNILDVLTILLVVSLLAAGMFLFVYVQKNISSAINTSLTGNPDATTALAMNTSVDNSFAWTIDFFVVMVMFGLPLLAMILAFFNNIHPFFFFASIGFSMLIVVVATWFSQGWSQFLASSDLSSMVYFMPMTNWVMSNFVVYAVFAILMLVFGVFVKSKSNQGYYQ